MILGVQSRPLPPNFPYYQEINQACDENNCPPPLAGAIAWRETLGSRAWLEATYHKSPANVISDDGGHGIFQLTSGFPANWADPYSNAVYAITQFIVPFMLKWNSTTGITGATLVKCTGASFNAGFTQAYAWHQQGDVDLYTTRQNGIPYGDGVLINYAHLAMGILPD